MEKSVIKMVYITAQYRVRLEIFPEQFFEYDAPPKELIKRARHKIETELQRGNIVYFEFYEEKLKKIWKIIRKRNLELTRPLSFTLAVGTPELPGVVLNPINDGKFIGYLDLFSTPEQIAKWRYLLVLLYVRYLIKEAGIQAPADPTFIHRACVMRKEGNLVRSFPVFQLPKKRVFEKAPFKVYANEEHGIVTVVIYDLKGGIDNYFIKQVLRSVTRQARALEEEHGFSFQIERTSIVRRIRSANRGPERFGIDLPLAILGAFRTLEKLPMRLRFRNEKFEEEPTIGVPLGLRTPDALPSELEDPFLKNMPASISMSRTAKASKGATGSSIQKGGMSETTASFESDQPREDSPFKDALVPEPPVNLSKYIKVEVTPDRLAATIASFDKAIYELDFNISAPQWLRFLEKEKITHGVDGTYSKLVVKNWAKKKDLSGMKIAQGDPFVKAETPFLYSTFRHQQEGTYRAPGAPKAEEGEVESDRLTPMLFASVGDVIAEVRYEQLPVVGKDVHGKPIEPPKPNSVVVTVGEGVEAKDNKFIAKINGIPKVDNQSVAVEKALVIDGDVSMQTGVIEFEGPVKVAGNVEEGAVLKIDGDLTVEGRVSGGQITVSGNLVATEGLVPAPGSSINVGKNVEAEFIENATFQCRGHIKALKSIMNSTLLAGTKIIVTEGEGVISGGAYTCGEDLKTYNLGLSMGSKTIFKVGSDIAAERSLFIRTNRVDRLEFLYEQTKASLDTLNVIPTNKLNKEQKNQKTEYRKVVKKLKNLLVKAKDHLDKAQSGINYNKEAVIEIKGMMSSNCEVTLGGVTIQNFDDVMEIRLRLGAGEKNMEALTGSSGDDEEDDAAA